jgi:hypothetical protein
VVFLLHILPETPRVPSVSSRSQNEGEFSLYKSSLFVGVSRISFGDFPNFLGEFSVFVRASTSTSFKPSLRWFSGSTFFALLKTVLTAFPIRRNPEAVLTQVFAVQEPLNPWHLHMVFNVFINTWKFNRDN